MKWQVLSLSFIEGDDGAVDIDDALNDDPESSFQFQTTELTSQYNDQIQRDTEAR